MTFSVDLKRIREERAPKAVFQIKAFLTQGQCLIDFIGVRQYKKNIRYIFYRDTSSYSLDDALIKCKT